MGWITLSAHKMGCINERNYLTKNLLRLSRERSRMKNDYSAQKSEIEYQRDNAINSLPSWEEYLTAKDEHVASLYGLNVNENKQESATSEADLLESLETYKQMEYEKASKYMTEGQSNVAENYISNPDSANYSFSDDGNMTVRLSDEEFYIIDAEGNKLETSNIGIGSAVSLMSDSQSDYFLDLSKTCSDTVNNARYTFDADNNIYMTAENGTIFTIDKDGNLTHVAMNYDKAEESMTKKQEKALGKYPMDIYTSGQYKFFDNGNMTISFGNNSVIIDPDGNTYESPSALTSKEVSKLMLEPQGTYLAGKISEGNTSINDASFVYDADYNLYITCKDGNKYAVNKNGNELEITEEMNKYFVDTKTDTKAAESTETTGEDSISETEKARAKYESIAKEYTKESGNITDYYDKKLKELEEELSDKEAENDNYQESIQAEIEKLTNEIQALDNSINNNISSSTIKFGI